MKSLLITGASSGIGAEIGRAAAHSGWKVFLGYDQGKERAHQLESEIASHQGQASTVHLPLHQQSDLLASIDQLSHMTDHLDALVLSASPPPAYLSLIKSTPEELERQFQVNVIGHQILLIECWKRFFRPQKSGHVVALLSTAQGPPPTPHMSSYVIAKQALETLMECAMVEWGSSGLRISAFKLGCTDTPMLRNVHPHILEAARSKTPQGSFLDPRNVAQRVLRCLQNPPDNLLPNVETIESADVRS